MIFPGNTEACFRIAASGPGNVFGTRLAVMVGDGQSQSCASACGASKHQVCALGIK